MVLEEWPLYMNIHAYMHAHTHKEKIKCSQKVYGKVRIGRIQQNSVSASQWGQGQDQMSNLKSLSPEYKQQLLIIVCPTPSPLIYLFIYFVCLRHPSHYNPGWPRSCYVDHGGLKLRDPSALAFLSANIKCICHHFICCLRQGFSMYYRLSQNSLHNLG